MIDEWSGLADLLAAMIEKYASELDLDELPDPVACDLSRYTAIITQTGLDKKTAA